jgi:hypothetical protein
MYKMYINVRYQIQAKYYIQISKFSSRFQTALEMCQLILLIHCTNLGNVCFSCWSTEFPHKFCILSAAWTEFSFLNILHNGHVIPRKWRSDFLSCPVVDKLVYCTYASSICLDSWGFIVTVCPLPRAFNCKWQPSWFNKSVWVSLVSSVKPCVTLQVTTELSGAAIV